MKEKYGKPPVERNDDIELEITALTSDGQGIGKYEGFTIFVPYALPTERISAHVIKVNKSYAIAKMTHKQNDSQMRAEPACKYYYQCGGCDLQHISYSEQLKFKRDRVFDALTRVAGQKIEPEQVKDTIAAEGETRYRNKASIPFADVDGSVSGGFFAIRSHRLIPVSDCIIQKSAAITVMRALCVWADRYEVSAYDEETGKGHLRHVVVRTNEAGEVLATVVTNGELKKQKQLISLLRENVPKLVGIISNINEENSNVILGRYFETIWGERSISEEICGLTFLVSAQSFLQVNHEQTEKLYRIAVDCLELSGTERVADVYCGIGTISLLLAEQAREVVGIESVKSAVDNARRNAEENGIENASFVFGEAERVLPRSIANGEKYDCIVIDPPRKGCEPEVMQAIAESGAKKVVYVSCNPQTLARDIKILCDAGYKLRFAQPVDMFPQTSSVETVALITLD